MIISRGRRYIFVHIPKTGGTSLALALESRAKADDILIGDTPKAVKRRGRLKGVTTAGRLWKHSTLADIDGLISLDELGGLALFAMVRNPWDRMVSYYHWLQAQSFAHPAVSLAKENSFEAFVLRPETARSWQASPARHYLTDAEGQERAAYFLRLEHFDEDKAVLEAHLGFAVQLPHENASERSRDWRSFYSDTLAEHLGAVAHEDIERFGYRFDS